MVFFRKKNRKPAPEKSKPVGFKFNFHQDSVGSDSSDSGESLFFFEIELRGKISKRLLSYFLYCLLLLILGGSPLLVWHLTNREVTPVLPPPPAKVSARRRGKPSTRGGRFEVELPTRSHQA